jgi:hypothetical protein
VPVEFKVSLLLMASRSGQKKSGKQKAESGKMGGENGGGYALLGRLLSSN